MPVTINGDGSITGLSAGGLPAGSVTDATIAGMAASKLSGALPAISGASLTGISGGIPFAQQWVLTSGFNPSSTSATVFSSNLAVKTGNGYGTIGSGTMTESSGVFTFPSTGIYRIECYIMFREESNLDTNAECDIQTATDGSSFSRACLTVVNTKQNDYVTCHGCLQFDVTNTSTHKCRFVYTARTTTYIHANSQNDSQTYFQFTKLGDT